MKVVTTGPDGKPVTKKLQKGKGQTETLARWTALLCVRLAVQMAVMVEYIFGHLPSECKWNVDASTMIIEDDGKGATMYRVVTSGEADEYEALKLKDPLTSTRFQTGLDMGLKTMCLGNANGDFGTMVLIIAVPNLPPGRFYRAKVQGLVYGSDQSKYGHVYFAATRCMTGLPEDITATVDSQGRPCNGWSDYFINIFSEDIKYYSDAYDTINPETGERFENASIIDGERCVDQHLLNPAVFEKLDRYKITMAKGRPSGTKLDNSLDQCTNFRDKNIGLAHCVKHGINTHNDRLYAELTEAFKGMRAAYPENTMSAAHEKKAIEGSMRYVYVCKGKWVTGAKLVHGFERCMQSRPPGSTLLRPILGHENSTVDAYGIIRKLCYTSITDPEMDHVLENFNPMLAIQGVNGRVTNAVMDTLNICKLPDGEHKDRDYLTFCQQGPMVITHAETRAREIAWGNRKEVAKVASERAKAEALIAKNAEKVAKEAADKVEKERLKAMTPAARKLDPATMEKARVAKEKREKSAAAKKEKETLDAQNLAAAIELVA
jgi:hypothetical protein